jgi:hypothetical protein
MLVFKSSPLLALAWFGFQVLRVVPMQPPKRDFEEFFFVLLVDNRFRQAIV